MKIELLPKDKCLNFVEFNITGDSENYNKCDAESLYLDSDIFNLFTHCFEKSNQLYEYFGQTKYNSKNIIPLRNELLSNLDDLNAVDSFEHFKQYIDNIFMGDGFIRKLERKDLNWQKRWDEYRGRLQKVNEDLVKLIDHCLNEDRILWVVGF